MIDFIGIGAPKCGTTKIARLLAAHPDICLSEPKEIQYFNELATYVQVSPNPNQSKGMDWYMQHFNHCLLGSVKGEFSSVYMYCPNAAKAVYEVFPKAKIIAAVRQPAERAFSHYLMLRYFQKRENRAFDELIYIEKEFINKGKYAEQLQVYFDLFGEENIRVVFLEDVKRNGVGVAQELYDFLGVNADFIPKDAEKRVNSAKAMRFKWLSILYGKIMVKMIDWGFSGVIHTLRRMGIKKIYDKLNYKNVPSFPDLSNESYNYITKACMDDINKLEILVNRDLSKWKELR